MKYYYALILTSILLTSEVHAAPKKYFWGETYGLQGISFHRQASNVSNFHVTLPMFCEFTDGTTDEIEASVSGPDVPDMYVARNRVSAEFTAYVGGLLLEGEVSVNGTFRGKRATFSVVVSSTFSDGTCSGGIVYSDIRRGSRIRR